LYNVIVEFNGLKKLEKIQDTVVGERILVQSGILTSHRSDRRVEVLCGIVIGCTRERRMGYGIRVGCIGMQQSKV
jgi:hypothetical protein